MVHNLPKKGSQPIPVQNCPKAAKNDTKASHIQHLLTRSSEPKGGPRVGGPRRMVHHLPKNTEHDDPTDITELLEQTPCPKENPLKTWQKAKGTTNPSRGSKGLL